MSKDFLFYDEKNQNPFPSNSESYLPKPYSSHSKPLDNIRIYVTLKKASDNNIEYKKMILMTSTNIKISMLKRQIEKEFSDLFPKEPTFICGKLEDEFGYSLSNSSLVIELLKYGDRIYAIPEGFSAENAEMHLTADIPELLFMLRSIQQNICSKLSDCSFKNYENISEILVALIPLGFSQSKMIIHNVAVVLNKIFINERLNFFEERNNTLIFNLLITLINYWIADLVSNDNFLLSATVDLLEVLNKSAIFSEQLKSAFVINNLMNLSKLDFISAQTRSRLIKSITYLSKGEFKNTYEARPISRSLINNKNDNNNFDNQNLLKEKNSSQTNSFYNNYNYDNNNKINNNNFQSKTSFKNYNNNEQKLIQNQSSSLYLKDDYSLKPKSSKYENNQFIDLKKPIEKIDKRGITTNLLSDFISLLNPENTREMLVFAIQNLEPTIEDIIPSIIENKQAYLQCLNLIEINLPPELHNSQIKILDTITNSLNEGRALDGLQAKIVPRLLKGFSLQNSKFQPVFFKMLQQHLNLGKFRIDVPTLIAMVSCPYVRLQELGIKILAEVSDPNVNEFTNLELQFENHIKFLIEISLNKKKSYEFKNFALMTISNLCLKDSLRPQVVYNSGIETLLFHLRNNENIEGQRIAAKGLLNLSLKSRDLKLRIVTELGDEMKKMQKNELDEIVNGYLQTLLQNRDHRFF